VTLGRCIATIRWASSHSRLVGSSGCAERFSPQFGQKVSLPKASPHRTQTRVSPSIISSHKPQQMLQLQDLPVGGAQVRCRNHGRAHLAEELREGGGGRLLGLGVHEQVKSRIDRAAAGAVCAPMAAD
jgi:hypothetical protein